jgi:hypothetical protein
MAANSFASLSNEELQDLLEDRDSSKTYKKQTNKHIDIQKPKKTFNLLIKHTYRYKHSEPSLP